MALPPGVTTGTVTFGPTVDFVGNPASITVEFVPSMSIFWVATGAPLVSFPLRAQAGIGQEGSIVLPHTDQPGFVDAEGNPASNWSYIATGGWRANGQAIPFRREFALPSGVGTIDLDKVPGTVGSTSPPSKVGPPGPPGTKILTGIVPPTAGTGNGSDFYIDTVGKTMYGPKAGTNWPVVLRGT